MSKKLDTVSFAFKNEEHVLKSGQLLIICADEGVRRGGKEHKRIGVYDESEFTQRQLAEIKRDPTFVVVRAI